ncbi:hypothetical protein LDENG_00124160 [Lucifuga dentata]|nr:hypothetical protein LDENG_00124160 [Lucifuga dentata]
MNRPKNVLLNSSGVSKGATPVFKQQQSARACQQNKEVKWKSSFKSLGEQDIQDDGSQDKSSSSSEKAELYDPYEPGSSDSESEMPQGQNHSHHPEQDDDDVRWHRYKHLSPGRGCHDNYHWELPYSESGSRPLNGRDFRPPETRPTEHQGPSPTNRLPERQPYSPNVESADPGYGSISRTLDRRSCSPDRLSHRSSNQNFTASYGGQMTNGDETMPEYRREMSTTVRLSPPRLQVDYQHQPGYVGTGADQITSTEVTKKKNRSPIIEKSPFTCELCDVELANKQELEDHLESKTHWDTMEHIQQQTNYDDLTVAFLQEVLLFKARHCSQAIEESKVQALQETDHMTRVELFHCAACKVYMSTSASSVQSHLRSQEHLCNKKDFEMRQRRACLDKAESVMKKLRPQFERFLQGGDPFE